MQLWLVCRRLNLHALGLEGVDERREVCAWTQSCGFGDEHLPQNVPLLLSSRGDPAAASARRRVHLLHSSPLHAIGKRLRSRVSGGQDLMLLCPG
jgi:hypothetical protein